MEKEMVFDMENWSKTFTSGEKEGVGRDELKISVK